MSTRTSSAHNWTLAEDLSLALAMADAADAITMDRFGSTSLRIDTKADLTPVTDADRSTEQALRELLGRHRPADAVLGEEFGSTEATNSRQWILDPIDGTKNYLRGVPVWATLIALSLGGAPTVGVVSAPALARRWWAALGSGAWRSFGTSAPVQIRSSNVESLAQASFSFSDAIGWPAGQLERLTTATARQRAYGDFWSHMLVAEGSVDIAAEPALGTWDMAALIPIVQEAGGQASGFDGADPIRAGSLLTSNRHLHEAVKELLHS
ncbi:MAG: inositol monophosphatase family protein [Actinomycetota bacterium]|nr:inositol monophosphatase family protein [Actinomycetota bacterium]